MKGALVALLLCAAASARGQTLLGQEQRLIDIHALLLDLPPVDAPGTYRAGQVSVGIEAIGVPPIDGSTGTPGTQGFKRQITASDRTPVFPRPRSRSACRRRNRSARSWASPTCRPSR